MMQLRGRQPSLRYLGAGALFTLLAVSLSLSCADLPETNEETTPLQAKRLADGQLLMQQYCSTCHLPVPATYLDRDTWLHHVLPVMAPKLGIEVRKNTYYLGQNADPGNVSSGPVIPFSDWTKIVEYFEREAPESLQPPDSATPLQREPPLFSVQKPRSMGNPLEPVTTATVPFDLWAARRTARQNRIATTAMVAFDPVARRLYSSDVTAQTIYRWNDNLEPVAINPSSLSAVDVSFVQDSTGDEHAVFTSIGTMRAVDAANGRVWDLNLTDGSNRVIAHNLPRPVCSLPGDFNNDGRRDWIVCGFGHTIGGLYVLEQRADHTYEKKAIRNVPGAIAAHARDFNHDGWLDVMVLFAHGDEGIWMFINDREGSFTAENVVRFPPVYGSTSFELVDFNGDGAADILYTSGDNADFSAILKPYHGVYIFLNRGGYRYEQAYFYPLNGTTQAMAADFDGDGDFDISAIAFFANMSADFPRTFVYLEQVGPLQFKAYVPPIQNYGRWISMDAGDFDGDMDVDLVLGNYSKAVLNEERIEAYWDTHTPFIVLENKTR